MLFSSSVFLFLFFPCVLFGYYVICRKSRTLQNVFLALCSLVFYAWGEPYFVFVMLVSIVINWILALLVDKHRENRRYAMAILTVMVAINLCILFVFKYLMFTLENINQYFNSGLSVSTIVLPIGLSFFTFQAVSYVVDVYRGHGKVQKNPLNVVLYIAFFPQLIAGPIVRYQTIADQIKSRTETFDDFSEGCRRFIIGLAKKMILSNNMALIADAAFGESELSVAFAWLGAIAYTLQIFFDFSGYSDMAIGLGKIFGFHFLENFNYPYISKSISEFWRRWHISLGSWFRDYVYFPLGGSRVSSKSRLVRNLFVVWFLTGLWHGANWTFILWGIMYFVLITLEKITGFEEKLGKIGHVYTLFFVIIGWVIFRASHLTHALKYISAMFGIGATGIIDDVSVYYATSNAVYLAFAILFSCPVATLWNKKWSNTLTSLIEQISVILLFLFALSFIVKGAYNPFIYFNF